MALVLTPQEIASFDGPFRITTVNGPLSLFRLCGRNAAGEAGRSDGRFWFNSKFFWNILDVISNNASNTALLNHYLRYVLREFTAVCYDWNNFASIYELSLPRGEAIEVAVGRIAPQMPFSLNDPAKRQGLPYDVLVGGEFQYIIDLDARLKKLVAGPRPLLTHLGHA